MKLKLLSSFGLAAFLGLLLPARASDTGTIYAALAGQKEHTVLLVAIKEAGEATRLQTAGAWTVFAPTDAAFKKLDDATVVAIATDTKVVQRLVRGHVVVGRFNTDALRKLDGKELKTVHGVALKVEVTKDGLRVGGAKIVSGDGGYSNGLIHVIDAVLPAPKE